MNHITTAERNRSVRNSVTRGTSLELARAAGDLLPGDCGRFSSGMWRGRQLREELSNPDQLAVPQSSGSHEIRVSPEGRSRSRRREE